VAEYRLRPRAIADLDEIWDYTVSTWNEAQAERYLMGRWRRASPRGRAAC
jgi:plasmid stabilization system protein ParE